MRIALPIADGKFSIHYGRAQALALHDVDLLKGSASSLGLRMFPAEGTCGSGQWVASQGVEILLAGGLGAGAARGLAEAGVTVLAGIEEEDARKVLGAYLAGFATVRELAPGESLCQGHDDAEGGQHGHHGADHVCSCKG